MEQAPESRDSEAAVDEAEDEADGGRQGAAEEEEEEEDVDQIELFSDGICDSIFWCSCFCSCSSCSP